MSGSIIDRLSMDSGADVMLGLLAASLAGSKVMAGPEALPTPRPMPPSRRTQPLDPAGKVLVAYDSICGSTAEVAEAIGSTLRQQGLGVDVLRVSQVGDVSGYRAAVIGSAVHTGHWLPECIEFVKANRQALAAMPVAYFLTCLTLHRPTEENRRRALTYLDSVFRQAPEVRPVDIGLFAGALDYGKLNLVVKLIMAEKLKAMGVPEGDHRDWAAISQWAAALPDKIQATGRGAALAAPLMC